MPDEEEKKEEIRESIWSVKAQDRYKFSIYFVLLFLPLLILNCFDKLCHNTEVGIYKIVFNLLKDIPVIGFSIVLLLFFLFEFKDFIGVGWEYFCKKIFNDALNTESEKIREELTEELTKKIREELTPELRKELRKELRGEILEEIIEDVLKAIYESNES